MTSRYHTAVDAANAGAEVLRRHYAQLYKLRFESKSDRSLVSQADRESESAVMAVIRDRYPNDATYGEESGMSAGTTSTTWYVDPLDGTSNFALGMTHFSVAVGLLDGDSPDVGVVVNPISRQVASASRGAGAWLDELPLKTRDACRTSLIVAVDVPHGGDARERQAKAALAGSTQRVTSLWSPALDYVALAGGRLDAIVCLGAEIEDKVPGLCLAREAGAIFATLSSEFSPSAFALTPGAAYAPWFVAAVSQRVLDIVITALQRGTP